MKCVLAFRIVEYIPYTYAIACSDNGALIEVERIKTEWFATARVEDVTPVRNGVLGVMTSGAYRGNLS